MSQLPPSLSKASHTAKTFVFLAARWKALTFRQTVVTFARWGGSEVATAHFWMPQVPPSFSGTFHQGKMFLFLSAFLLKAKKLKPFQEDNQFLKYSTIVTWRVWCHVLPEKSSKGFSSQTRCPVKSKSSWRNLPGEAFHNGERSVVPLSDVPFPRS